MNLDKLLEQSKKIDNLLASIFDTTLQYAESAVQDAVTDTLRDDEDNEVLYDTYCFARVHSSKSSIGKFIRKKRRELSSDVLELLDIWRKHPVHWVVMRLREPLGQDLYSMVDTITGDEFILYAPRLPEIVRDALVGKQLFVACLFFNGRCEQALDLIHFYPLLEDDLHWYTRSYMRKGSSLTQAVLDNYLDFFAIDELSEAELKQHQGEVHCVYWAEIALEKLPDTPLPGKWDRETAGDIDQLIYRGPDAALEKIAPPRMLAAENRNVKKRKLWKSVDHFYPEIYLDRENKRACIVAYSRYDFFLCRELLQLAVDENLSELSYDGKLSVPMYDFFLEQESFPLPVSPYIESFDKETSDVFTHFRKLVDNMLTLIENGTFDRQHLIKELDLDEEQLSRISELLETDIFDTDPDETMTVFTVPEEDRAFQISHPAEISPNLKLLCHSTGETAGLWKRPDLDHCTKLFCTLVPSPEKQQQAADNLPWYIEELFYDHISDEFLPPFTYNYFCYLLYVYGSEWLPVRSYALELFREIYFHTEAVPEDYEPFVEEFSQFVFRHLCTNGICQVQKRPSGSDRKRGLYAIRPTELLTSLYVPADQYC